MLCRPCQRLDKTLTMERTWKNTKYTTLVCPFFHSTISTRRFCRLEILIFQIQFLQYHFPNLLNVFFPQLDLRASSSACLVYLCPFGVRRRPWFEHICAGQTDRQTDRQTFIIEYGDQNWMSSSSKIGARRR